MNKLLTQHVADGFEHSKKSPFKTRVTSVQVSQVFNLPEQLRAEPHLALECARNYTAHNVPVNLEKSYGIKARTVSDLVDEINIPAQQKQVIHGILAGVVVEHMEKARNATDETHYEWPDDSAAVPSHNFWASNLFHITEEILHVVAQALFDRDLDQAGHTENNAKVGERIISSLITDFRKGKGPKEVLVHHMNAYDMLTQEGLSEVMAKAGVKVNDIQRSVIGHQPFPPFIMSLLFRILIEGRINTEAETAVKDALDRLGTTVERKQEIQDVVSELAVGVSSDEELSARLAEAESSGDIATKERDELNTAEVRAALLKRYSVNDIARRNEFYGKIANPQEHIVQGQDEIALDEEDIALMELVDPRFKEHKWTYPQQNDSLTWAVFRADAAQYPGSALIKLIPQRGPDTFAQDLLLFDPTEEHPSTVGSIIGNDPEKSSFGACLQHMDSGAQRYYQMLKGVVSKVVQGAIDAVLKSADNAELFERLRVPEDVLSGEEKRTAHYYFLDYPLPHDENGSYLDREGQNKDIFDAAIELRTKVVEHVTILHNEALASGAYFTPQDYDVQKVRERHDEARGQSTVGVAKFEKTFSAPELFKSGFPVASQRGSRLSDVDELTTVLSFSGGRESCPEFVSDFIGRESRLSSKAPSRSGSYSAQTHSSEA